MTTFHRRPHEPANAPIFHHFGFRCAAHVDDPAAADRHAGLANGLERVEPILIGVGRANLPVVVLAGVEVVVDAVDTRFGQRIVQVRDVGLVVLRVVNLHRARIDVRLERIVDLPPVTTDPSDPWVAEVFDVMEPLIGERPEPRESTRTQA